MTTYSVGRGISCGNTRLSWMSLADTRRGPSRLSASANLGDPRRTRRLVESAAKIAAHPEKSFTQVFDWNELRGFYRLCDQSEATLPAVMDPHWQQTQQAMGQQPLVLIVHDTTNWIFPAIASWSAWARSATKTAAAFLQHNSLAVVPQPRQVLGLAYQQLKVRAAGSRRGKHVPAETPATRVGLVVGGISRLGPSTRGLLLGGCLRPRQRRLRGDAAALGRLAHHFLFAGQPESPGVRHPRARPARVPAGLRPIVAQRRIATTVEIPGRGGRPARTATVSLAAAPVWVPAPAGTAKRQPNRSWLRG